MITIVDYNAGNLTSVKRALDFLGLQSQITPDPEVVTKADRIIFPGVGHAGAAMAVLKERGLDQALKTAFGRGVPILGICVGAQILLDRSLEGDTACLGIIQGECPRFSLKDPLLKIPHMGWNSVRITRPHPVLKTLASGDQVYFVHSYYPKPSSNDAVFAVSDYEIEFPCAIGRDNIFATQFHPEKSGPVGLAILKNFAQWDGSPC